MLLNWRKLVAAISFSIFLVACSGSNTSNSVPAPIDPNASPNPALPGAGTNPDVDPEILKFITNAAPIKLVDNTTFTGLSNILGASGDQFFAPLVGDPKLRLVVPNTRETLVNATLFFSIEDSKGFWGMQQNSFPGTAFQLSNGIDMIFSDTAITTRIYAPLTNGNLSGTVTYRVRQAGETQCQCECTIASPGADCVPIPNCFSNPNTPTLCRNYMASGTQTLGTFEAVYSTWVQ